MTPYLDTSALVKLCIDEDSSSDVWRIVEGLQPATCRITWAEARSALARREREQPADAAVWAVARHRLSEDWRRLHLVEVSQPLVEKAGEFADVFALRAYDAVQLAAAHLVQRTLVEPVGFVCFDRRLNRAARLLGLQVPEGFPT